METALSNKFADTSAIEDTVLLITSLTMNAEDNCFHKPGFS